MQPPEQVYHIAIPCADLDESERYYVDGLNCRRARRYHDRITLDFFGAQLVCHLAPEDVVDTPKVYPRHFGITFRDADSFDAVYAMAQEKGLPIFKEKFTRFKDMQEEHYTFFLIDPANNLIEFKYYHDTSMMY